MIVQQLDTLLEFCNELIQNARLNHDDEAILRKLIDEERQAHYIELAVQIENVTIPPGGVKCEDFEVTVGHNGYDYNASVVEICDINYATIKKRQ